jgi:hypothetical protein
MPGIGELAVYDIAHRIAAFRGKEPSLVYLHRGTCVGARHLGFTGKTLDPRLLPSSFSCLTAAEIEDCLCIYKDDFVPDRGSGRRRIGLLRACIDMPGCRGGKYRSEVRKMSCR